MPEHGGVPGRDCTMREGGLAEWNAWFGDLSGGPEERAEVNDSQVDFMLGHWGSGN